MALVKTEKYTQKLNLYHMHITDQLAPKT